MDGQSFYLLSLSFSCRHLLSHFGSQLERYVFRVASLITLTCTLPCVDGLR